MRANQGQAISNDCAEKTAVYLTEEVPTFTNSERQSGFCTEWLSYQLTTFRQDFKRLARESVKIITDQINNQNSRLVKMMVPVKLVERRTTKQR